MPKIDSPPSWRAEYDRARRKAVLPVTFKDEAEKNEFLALARAQGFRSFNAWAVHTLTTSVVRETYPPEYVGGLEAEVRKLREWIRQKDEQIQEQATEIRALHLQMQDLLLVLQSLAHKEPAADRAVRKATAAEGA